VAYRADSCHTRRGRELIVVTECGLHGVFAVEPDRHADERGAFERLYCGREFAEHGIDFAPVQISVSANTRRGTLRGLHFQAPPRAEGKVVACIHGSVFDVIVDLREDSATYARWIGLELTKENRQAIYVPPGCAHGFQTLEDNTDLLYLISEFYDPGLQRGVRWDDPAIGIEWPDVAERVISARDRQLPLLAVPESE
jgi:dTDP-4-dehydrorhamnose 3,5-epimerase